MLTITFSAAIFHWRGPSPYHFVRVPPEEAANLKAISSLVTYGWGMLPALVRIGRTEWRTALWPKDGSYIVPIKDAVRGAEGLSVDDEVLVVLKLER